MKNTIFYVMVMFFGVVIFSCHSVDESVYKKINVAGGDFRGVCIRSSPEEVKQKENTPPKNEEADFLFYEFPLNGNDEFFTVGYSFNEKGVYEILLDVNLSKPEDALGLFQSFSADFRSRYGEPRQEDESTVVWTIKSERSEEVELTLSDESDSDNAGKISVSLYDMAY